MPKDVTKNVDRYKIRGGQLNEFDFQQNQEAFAESQTPTAPNLIPGTPPEAKEPERESATKAIKAAKATKSAKSTKRGKATKAAKATKATKAAKSARATKSVKASKARKALPRGATAKKLAARKAAKKK
jgi:hypothetical protein